MPTAIGAALAKIKNAEFVTVTRNTRKLKRKPKPTG